MSSSGSKRPPAAFKPSLESGESQAAVAVTIAWMLATMTTLATELLSLVAEVAVWSAPRLVLLAPLGRLMLFAAGVSGVVSLVLCVLACRVRNTWPPTTVIVATMAIALIPLAAVVLILAKR